MSLDSSRPAHRALDAAIVALRRGEPVLLAGRDEAMLVLAAEFVDEANLGRLREVSSRPRRLVLTRRRAVALGLAARDELSGAVSITLPPELSAAVICNLADPAASLGAEPPGLGSEPANAEGGERAAVALAKLAALLPAALILPLAAAEAGGGVLLYLAQEGRGIGLINKLRAYQLQDAGFDTVDANEQLGFDADERVYLPAAEMLRQLAFNTVRLLTNNPEKVSALERYGIRVVERVPHVFPANGHNERYLRTKATRSGHLL